MKKIIYNEPSDERASTKSLTLKECEDVVELINQIKFGNIICTESQNNLLQRFVWNYENLDHHKSVVNGLWATDEKEEISDPMNKLFKIKYE